MTSTNKQQTHPGRSGRELLDADLQQRESAINTQLREARELALSKVSAPTSSAALWGKRTFQIGVPAAAMAVALVVAVPLFNGDGQPLQTADMAIEDPQLLEDFELALWFAEMQADET